MSIQSTIHSLLPTLPPSTKRVAEAVIADPDVVLRLTISALAQLCGTSEPSVVRFCRLAGFSGYVQLRLAMATEIGREAAAIPEARRFGEDISPEDSLADAVAKVRFTETLGLEETLRNLDLEALSTVVGIIDRAPKILLYGVGAGGMVADDLRYKLFRIGRDATAFGDIHDALMGASLMGPDDVAIAFSHSGRTQETLEFIRAAKAAGSRAVAVTNVSTSPLAAAADASLLTVVRETAFRAGAMASRIAQLAVVDCMFVGVAQLSFDATIGALETTRQAVAGRTRNR
ncbi:MAG: MurR/RpiR family transcriptional regulator [Actinomycetales bacterium]